MQKASFKESLQPFFEKLEWYKDFLAKIANLKSLEQSEKKDIFESTALQLYVRWECLTEALFIDCLNRDTSQYAEFHDIQLPSHSTRAQCEAFVCGLGFFDSKGFSGLLKIAKQNLTVQYNPFKHSKSKILIQEDLKKIEEFYFIRNYLAHRSRKSKLTLKRNVYDRYELRRFVEPGSYLLAKDRKTNQPRLMIYREAFFTAADEMGVFLGV